MKSQRVISAARGWEYFAEDYLSEMNMDLDLDINPADLQFFEEFGLDLDFIISDAPDLDLDLDLIILFKFFLNARFSFKITVFNVCSDIMCYYVIDLCKFVQVWFKFNENKT